MKNKILIMTLIITLFGVLITQTGCFALDMFKEIKQGTNKIKQTKKMYKEMSDIPDGLMTKDELDNTIYYYDVKKAGIKDLNNETEIKESIYKYIKQKYNFNSESTKENLKEADFDIEEIQSEINEGVLYAINDFHNNRSKFNTKEEVYNAVANTYAFKLDKTIYIINKYSNLFK